MDYRKSQTGKNPWYFADSYQESEFWPCCGYDGLSILFHVPLEALRPLPETQKRALMRLWCYLADTHDNPLQDQIRALENQTPEQRWVGLIELSAPFGA